MLTFDHTFYFLEVSLALGVIWALLCLPALWAATGKRHWLARAAAPLVAVVLLLPTRAHEGVILLLIYSAIVSAGMTAAGYWKRWRQQASDGQRGLPRVTFSLRDLMLMTLVVAIVMAISTGAFKQWVWFNWPDLSKLAMTGLGSALLALSCLWLVLGRRRIWLRVAVWMLVVAAVSGMRYQEIYWEPIEDSSFAYTYSGFFPQRYGSIIDFIIFATLPAILQALSLTVCLGLALLGSALFQKHDRPSKPKSPLKRRLRVVGQIALVAVVVVILAPNAFIYWRLARPLPPVEQNLPSPNGYDALLAAANRLQNANVPYDEDISTPKTFAAFSQQYQSVFDEAHDALQLNCRVPLDYSPAGANFGTDDIQALRILANGLKAASVSAANQGEFDESAGYALDCVLLANQLDRGGLVIDWLVGAACEGVGVDRLGKQIENFSAATCHQLIDSLQKIDLDREPLGEIIHRDEVWDRYIYGWKLELTEAIDFLFGQTYGWSASLHGTNVRRDTMLRLLIAELALRAHMLENDGQPESLQRLVPQYMDRVPVDPYSSDGQPLICRQVGDETLIYSVGPNGVDDGGQRVTWDQWGRDEGDFFLLMKDDLPADDSAELEN